MPAQQRARFDNHQCLFPILHAAGVHEEPEALAVIEVRSLDLALENGDQFGFTESWITKVPLVGGLFSNVQQFISQYEKIGVKIDRIVAELDKSRMVLNRDIVLLDQWYDQNRGYFRNLLTYIAAGELKLQELGPQHDKLAAETRASNDPVLVQQASDLNNAIARLERRVYDLKLASMISLQTAPQIRLAQNGDQSLVEKIQTSMTQRDPSSAKPHFLGAAQQAERINFIRIIMICSEQLCTLALKDQEIEQAEQFALTCLRISREGGRLASSSHPCATLPASILCKEILTQPCSSWR